MKLLKMIKLIVLKRKVQNEPVKKISFYILPKL